MKNVIISILVGISVFEGIRLNNANIDLDMLNRSYFEQIDYDAKEYDEIKAERDIYKNQAEYFLQTLSEENSETLDTEMYGNQFTRNDINLMLRTIETETYQAPIEAKINVANVILNRLHDDRFSNNVSEIITDDLQFAYGRKHISEETRIALEYAIKCDDTTNGAIGFRSDCNPTKWNGWTYQFTDKAGHAFYK